MLTIPNSEEGVRRDVTMTERMGDSNDPLIGQEVAGRYRVIRRIGRGGMGSIYEVHHNRLDRSFAMKTLAWEVAQEQEAVARFRREADVIAKLRHAHIVEIIDWDTLADGTPCLIMEYLRGEDLASRIRKQGPLPWNVIAQVADQVLSALVVAHAAGVVHRDLKPQNIFLSVDDAGEERAKLLDFGVSKISGLQSLTTESRLIGTPQYMSPEQAEGVQDNVGEPTDVWAMGAILYEMATGKPAFDGANLPAILYKICHGTFDSASEGRVDAPAAFVELVERSLTRDPAKRITRVHAMRASLRRALTGLRGVSYPEVLRAQTPPTGTPITLALDPTVSGPITPSPITPTTTLSRTAAESFGARAAAAPAPGGRSRGIWIAGSALTVIAVAAIVFVALRGDSVPATAAAPDARVDVAPPDAAVVVVEHPVDAPLKIKHTIRSSPAGARVMRESDKMSLGVTPLELQLDPGGAIGYVVEKTGYVKQRIELAGERDDNVEVTLAFDKKKPAETPKPPIEKPPVGTTKPPVVPVPCRKKGEPPNPFDKKPPCPA